MIASVVLHPGVLVCAGASRFNVIHTTGVSSEELELDVMLTHRQKLSSNRKRGGGSFCHTVSEMFTCIAAEAIDIKRHRDGPYARPFSSQSA